MVIKEGFRSKAIIVLQGRVRSTRLPGKGFFHFFDQTIWERMCEIATSCDFADRVVFATGDSEENYLIESTIKTKGVEFFVGSESDVFDRFSQVSKKYPSEFIVRLTCDNYLVQPELMEDLFHLVDSANADYGFIQPLSHFSGEVIRSKLFDSLNNASDMAKEHVTWDIRADPSVSKVSLSSSFKGLDHANSITLDDVDDFVLMKTLESSFEGLKSVRCIETLKKIDIRKIINSHK